MSTLGYLLATVLAPSFAATDLRCEYLLNPINVGSSNPRLSWIDEARTRNWSQSAYQIQVASRREELESGHAALWDSQKTPSAQSSQIKYRGKSLSAQDSCWWRVRVWDNQGAVSGWSRPAHFEIGLLSEKDWGTSQWIGINGKPEDHPAPYLRKEFLIGEKVRRARVYAVGLGYAEIHINGQNVAPGTEREPGYTNFDKRVLSVSYDVTSLIKKGPNAIGAILGTGWYDVHDLATWNFDRAPWRARPKLRLVLAIETVDGKTEFINSDSSWKITNGPILRDGIYTGEIYDARKELGNWDRSTYADSGWSKAEVMEAPKGKIVPRACPPVMVGQTIRAKKITEPKPGVYVVDFGQNFAGHVRLKVNAPAGTRITLRYSERLDRDGMIERSQIEQFMAKQTSPQPFQSDTYICRGGDLETWEQSFSYSGFRFMEVTGLPTRPTLGDLEGRFAHTEFESAGTFACSDDTLNRIQSATRYSYLSNAQSIPTDCPQREKNGWTGDAQLAAEAGLMNFRSETFYTKWLDDLADTESDNGLMSIIVPTGGWGSGARHPAWDSAYPIVADDLNLYLNDQEAIATHYEGLKKYVDSLATELKMGVLTFDSLGDWVPWKTETPSTYTSTVYLYEDAKILSRVATNLGKTEDAKHFADLASLVRAGINHEFYKKGTYANGSQTALSMALYFDLVPKERRLKVFGDLVKNVVSQGHIDTGILGAKYLIRVLSENGRSDLAYQLIARKEQPSWAWWIAQGATTLWEDWKGESSLNHIMFGDVSNWFYQWIAGIGLDESAPGFSHILIHPQPVGGIQWAKADHMSPHGRILSAWKLNQEGFTLNVSIPANTTATVVIPFGTSVTESGRKVEDLPDIQVVSHTLNQTVLHVGSGNYSFAAK